MRENYPALFGDEQSKKGGRMKRYRVFCTLVVLYLCFYYCSWGLFALLSRVQLHVICVGVVNACWAFVGVFVGATVMF